MSNLTLKDIVACEEMQSRILRELDIIGRELYAMREGYTLPSGYGFDHYSRTFKEGAEYYEQEGPSWDKGTPIFSIIYYWPRTEDGVGVTFPQVWLDKDWRALERARIKVEQAAEADRKNAANEEAARQREEAERRNYERLREKFEVRP